MLWHQNSGAKPLSLNSGAKLHFAGVAPLLEFGTKRKRAEAATRRGKKEEKRHEIEMKKQLKNQQEETEKKEKE
ncbi:hypothetical protein Tco_1451649 [Tanacetum coccineum]